MSSTNAPPPRTPFKSTSSGCAPTPSFLQQRDALVGEISQAMDHVLQNINKLNRSLEGVIAVGNEFGAVEALWSQFENVMAKEPGDGDDRKLDGHEGGDEMEADDGATPESAEQRNGKTVEGRK
ncbi:MAG: hypothetical protein Q9172_001057 [Xanthocarpia lactea]